MTRHRVPADVKKEMRLGIYLNELNPNKCKNAIGLRQAKKLIKPGSTISTSQARKMNLYLKRAYVYYDRRKRNQYGIRALYRLLVTYANKYGIRSVDEIIDRYAPPGENSESARANYKQFVKDTASTDMMNTRGDLYAIGKGIMIFETSKSDWDTYIVA